MYFLGNIGQQQNCELQYTFLSPTLNLIPLFIFKHRSLGWGTGDILMGYTHQMQRAAVSLFSVKRHFFTAVAFCFKEEKKFHNEWVLDASETLVIGTLA